MKRLLILCAIATLMAGRAGTADADLLYSASMRNGDYGGGAAIDTMDGPYGHGASPHVLGIVNSPQGTTFTSTEADFRSNALINWQITDATQLNNFRNHGTFSFWVKFDSVEFVQGWLFNDNFGFSGWNNGQSAFGSHAYKKDDGVMLSWSAWCNNVWDYPYDNTNRLQFDRWYNVGYAWGGPSNNFEIWVNGVLVSAINWGAGHDFPWGMEYPPSGTNFGFGDNHQRGYDSYGSVAGATFADVNIWNEYRMFGDTSKPDTDGDGISDDEDLCPDTAPGASVQTEDGKCKGCSAAQCDTDDDGIKDDVDNCINVSNPGQEDGDNDGKGLACEDACDAVCASAKLNAIADYVTGLINCEAKGKAVDICNSKASVKFEGTTSKTGAWDKAQAKANKGKNCDTGPIDAVVTDVNSALADIYGQISSNIGAGDKNAIKLSSDMLKALGKLCGARLKAESAFFKGKAKNADKAFTARMIAIGKACNAYDKSFEKLKAKYGSVINFSKLSNLRDEINTLVSNIIEDMYLSDM